MTRRHFEMIARTVREAGGDVLLAETFAAELAQTNPRFDRARFLRACEVQR